jgi:tetratricopeptide (TPR) repeat protein
MGRSRRRNRHRGGLGQHPLVHVEPLPASSDALEPVFVSVGAHAWQAESDAPVLPLDGLAPWEEIRGPAIALYEDAEEVSALMPESDSRDPAQLDLAAQTPPAPRVVLESSTPHPAEESSPPPRAEPPAADDDEFDELDEPPLAVGPAESESHEHIVTEVADAAPVEAVEPDAHDVAAAQAVALAGERAGRGDQAGALAILDRAVDADPDRPLLLVERGGLLGHLGRYAAAERDLRRVLRVDPSHPHALYALGVVMTKKGLWGEAVPLLRRAVELEPERGSTHFYLGEALNHVDDLAGALAAYERAAVLLPDNPRALYGLGIVYDRLGRPEDAARMYRRSREIARR